MVVVDRSRFADRSLGEELSDLGEHTATTGSAEQSRLCRGGRRRAEQTQMGVAVGELETAVPIVSSGMPSRTGLNRNGGGVNEAIPRRRSAARAIARPTALRGIVQVAVLDYMRHEPKGADGKEEDGGTEARSRVELSRLYQLAGNGTFGIRAAGPGS